MINKIKKGTIVVVLTLLIWTWAYQAGEETFDTVATLDVSRATDPSLLVTFDGYLHEEFKVEIAGPASKINDFEDKLNKGLEKLEFVFNAETEGMSTPGRQSLNLLKFLKNSDRIAKLGFTVKSCSVETIDVMVKQLEKKLLTVQCLDENNLSLPYESLNPSRVNMFVHPNWEGVKASIVLNPQDIIQARKAPIQQTPFVELLPGVLRYADEPVKVKLFSTETPLADQVLAGSSIAIGYVFSSQTKGKYDVELLNEPDLISITKFKATDTAIAAYQAQKYQILIEIRDSDVNEDQVTREIVYNFPLNFVAKNEISFSGTPPAAIFRLVPKTGTQTAN